MLIEQLLAISQSKLSVTGFAFETINGTSNGSITIPSGTVDSYLYILYENSTSSRPTITGFTTLSSRNGVFSGVGCTQVLMQSTSASGTITIPNSATFNGFAATLIGFNKSTTYTSAAVTDGGFSSTVSFSKADGFYVHLYGIDSFSETFTAWTLDSDFTDSDTYLSGDGAVSGRAAAAGVVDDTLNSGNITLNNLSPSAGGGLVYASLYVS